MEFEGKKGLNTLIISLFFIILFTHSISSEIIFTQNTKEIYNVGDSVNIPITIKGAEEISGILELNLICGTQTINFYKNGIHVNLGEEKSFESSLILIKPIIGDILGECKIKGTLNEEYALTNKFSISKSLTIIRDFSSREFDVGESISIKGKVTKENLDELDGYIEAKVIDNKGNVKLSQTGTVSEGSVNLNLSIPEDLASGDYTIKLFAYEKDSSGDIINEGSSTDDIFIKQMPKSLELTFEKEEVQPEDSLFLTATLYDQTQEKMNSSVIITITNSQGELIEQKEILTQEEMTYIILDKELPSTWAVSAESRGLTTQESFDIINQEKIDVQIVNKTIFISNLGNVRYNKTLLVKIEEIPLNIQVDLNVGESKKYLVSAPKGEYQVTLTTGEGQEISNTMSLTGNAVSVQESSGVSLRLFGWIIVTLVGLFGLYQLIRLIKKKRKMGRSRRFHFKQKIKENKPIAKNKQKDMPIMMGNSILMPVNKAELSLSIKGTQQDISAVCLKIKNLNENERGSPAETIKKIIDLASEHKAVTYENSDYLIFLFSPMKTKTMRNEMLALSYAEKIKDILVEHNRKFNQKLDFGISLNNGTIVAKVESSTFRFMGMGTFMSMLKRIASLSNQEILLSQEMNNLLALKIKSSKEMRDGTSVYTLDSIKQENDETTKFINKFLNRQSGY